MTILLLVLLAVSAVVAILLDRKTERANERRLATRHDGVPFTRNQIENRRALRHVIWLWMYGYAPPGIVTRSQRMVIGLGVSLVIFSFATAIVTVIARFLR